MQEEKRDNDLNEERKQELRERIKQSNFPSLEELRERFKDWPEVIGRVVKK